MGRRAGLLGPPIDLGEDPSSGSAQKAVVDDHCPRMPAMSKVQLRPGPWTNGILARLPLRADLVGAVVRIPHASA